MQMMLAYLVGAPGEPNKARGEVRSIEDMVDDGLYALRLQGRAV